MIGDDEVAYRCGLAYVAGTAITFAALAGFGIALIVERILRRKP